MGEVIAYLAMSLDGFIADPDDGCDELSGFYQGGGVPVFFETSVQAAVAKARELAGGQDVIIAGATVTCGCLDAGLLDAIQVSLVPVILGEGIPRLAGTRGRGDRSERRISLVERHSASTTFRDGSPAGLCVS
jgi:dihydrofolate reductase